MQKFILSAFFIIILNSTYAADFKAIEQELSDSVITTKITSKFTQNTNLNPLKIWVTTDNGIATLHGHVKDKAAFVEALRLTKTTKGVKSINADDLEIKQVNTGFTDTYITAKIEAAVLKAKVLDDESIPLVGINATTTNGIVTLSGTVKNSKSISIILKRALAVRGVKQVISNLRVSSL